MPPIAKPIATVDVLDEEEHDEEHDADDRDRRVLAAEVRGGALLDGRRQGLHGGVAGRQREQRPGRQQPVRDRERRAHQRDDDPVVGQEIGQGNLSGIKETRSGSPGGPPLTRAVYLLARHPEPPGLLGGALAHRAARRAVRAACRRLLAGHLHVGHLEPRQCVLDRGQRLAVAGLDDRQQGAGTVDRVLDLRQSGSESSASPALRAPRLSSVTIVWSSTSSTVSFAISASRARISSSDGCLIGRSRSPRRIWRTPRKGRRRRRSCAAVAARR